MSESLVRAASVLSSQWSLITTTQAAEVGIGRERCRDLVRRGIWERPVRGLYGPAGVAWTWRRRLMAAVLLAPEGSLVSHRCAATLLGVGGLQDPQAEITIPRGKTFRRSWVTVHESTDLELADRRLVEGIPTTGPRRLAMDLGAVVSEARYRQTVREIRFRHGLTSETLLRTYLRHKRSGRNGGGALRDWLDRYYEVEGVPESGLEQLALDAFLDARLPTPVAQLVVEVADHRRYRIDFAFPELMLAIEVDGSQHQERDHGESDRRRDETLKALGWTVIRIRVGTFASDLAHAVAIVHARYRDSVVSLSGHP